MSSGPQPQPEDFKRLSEALERERQRLVAAQAVAKVGSWETDLRTLDVVWSDETFRIFGLDPASYVPHHESFLSFVHPDDRALVDEAFRKSFGTRDVCTVQHRVVAADGTVKIVEEHWQTFVDEAGVPILAAVELLREETDPAERERTLASIEASARRGADMVRQVLAFARGGPAMNIPLEVPRVLEDVRSILTESLPKDIALRVDVAPDLSQVRGDATQLHQLLMNVCLNARDAMPFGGVLTITADEERLDDLYAGMHPQAQPGRYVRLTIADTGQGIPPTVQERMFEPFFTTKELGRGTGLGLSTVHSIARAMGGFVNVYSEPGRGARFVVYLPALPGEAPVVPPRTAEEPPPRGKGELVLVVDDEEAIRTVVQRTLERSGYRVRAAANGAEGVATFVECRGDVRLIITDMAMPVLDGPSMVRAVRAIDGSLPIIGSSGLTGLDGGGVPSDVVVDAWVPKPYSAGMLLRTVREVLDAPR